MDDILKGKTNEQVYDSVFWMSMRRLSEYIVPLINEVFSEKFTQNATVRFEAGKQIIESTGSMLERREVDAIVYLSEQFEKMVEKAYHFECETRGRKSISIRIAEYASGYAFQHVVPTRIGADIKIPHSAVIFLRSSSEHLSKLVMGIDYPGGRVEYSIPVINIRDYTLNELIDKKLLLLIPFYAFIYSDRELKEMDADKSKLQLLESTLNDIGERLNVLVDTGYIEPWQRGNIVRYTTIVLRKLLGKYTNVVKGVEEIMGGYIFKTDIDEAMDAGELRGYYKLITSGKLSVEDAAEQTGITIDKFLATMKANGFTIPDENTVLV